MGRKGVPTPQRCNDGNITGNTVTRAYSDYSSRRCGEIDINQFTNGMFQTRRLIEEHDSLRYRSPRLKKRVPTC